MKKHINKIYLFILLIFTFSLVGCMPKGDPNEVINKYYQSIKDGNPEGAYETLSEASKKNFSKEDFVEWQNVEKEVSLLKDTKIEKTNEYKNKELDGIKYKKVVEFNVSEKIQDFYNNKEDTISYKRNVVNDNGTWKVYREKENGEEVLAGAYNKLACMYIDGKGKDRNLNEAAIILNNSLKKNPNFFSNYYSLGFTYVGLRRYDDAINAINSYLLKEKDNEWRSNGYNILGNAYLGKENFSKAKECYNQAIKLDANNQYAKTNLELIKQY